MFELRSAFGFAVGKPGSAAAAGLLACVCLLAGALPRADAAAWTSYRGGPSQNMSGTEDPGTGPQQIWTSIASTRSEPCVISNGESVFTVATPPADSGAQRLFRIDAASGKTIWSSAAFSSDPGSSCPATDGSRVYFAHGSHLTALSASSGEQAWDVDLGGIVGMPVVSSGIVYANAGEGKEAGLFARNAFTGSAAWSAPVPASRLAPLVVAGAVVNLAREGSPALSAFDAASGESLWTAGGALYDAIGVGESVIYSIGEVVVSRRAPTGALSWSYTVPPASLAKGLVADSPSVYVLASADIANGGTDHLISLDEGGEVRYDRQFEQVESCCPTTSAHPPFVKFGSTLYNQYRYFDAATGKSPGGPFDQTQKVFYDGEGCANEQDSMFAHVGYTIYAWKSKCSEWLLVARRDAVAPEPFALTSPTDGATVQQPRPTLTWQQATDNAGGTGIDHYEVVLDEEQIATKLPPGTESVMPDFDLQAGGHSWYVAAYDRAGSKRKSETRSFTVSIDNTPPDAFGLIAPADGATTGPRPSFSWEPAVDSGSGLSRYYLILDGKEFLAEKEAFTPGFDLESGLHKWFVIAVDKAGNTRYSEGRTFTVDTNPPGAFNLIEPELGAVTGPRPRFSWEAAPSKEEGGLDHYELTLDGEALASLPAGTESFVPEFDLGEGVHKWWVTAVDSFGNRLQSDVRYFSVDAAAPGAVELIEPGPEAVTAVRPQFRWYGTGDSGEAGVDHYELVLDKATLAEFPAGKEIFSFTPESDLAGGTHSWSVTAVDGVGNRSQSETRTFTVDASPPEPFALVAPADKAVTSVFPQFVWEAASDTGGAGLGYYELIIDGKSRVIELAPGEASFTPSDPVEAGSHSWSVVAVDRAGNRRQSETRTFTVDASPPAQFGLLAPADEAVTDARPHFAWETATDEGGSGIGGYRLVLDGEVLTETPPGTESFEPKADLAPGLHSWRVIAVDKVGNERSSETRSFIVASPPVAALAQSSVLVLTGSPVTFDASSSKPPAAGAITRYEWDLDGNGTYERDTGAVPTTSQTYTKVGDLTVSVRVSSNLGTDATASEKVSVRLAPPPGPLGVTINNGAQFTNDPNVTVSPIWPTFALTALISNDGGFRAAAAFPVAAGIPWKLESSGAERLPKTIYLRFQGGEAGRETYQDDIILDQRKPKVVAASVSEGENLLRVQASDAVSGVAALQVLNGRGHPGRWVPFKSRVRLATHGARVFVRVRDRASNVSAWRRVAR